MNLFTHIANKPRPYREKVALSSAAVVTSLVFMVWFSTLGERLDIKGGTLSADNQDSAVAAVPFAVEEISKQFDTIQGTLNLLRGTEPSPSLEASSGDTSQTLIPENTDATF